MHKSLVTVAAMLTNLSILQLVNASPEWGRHLPQVTQSLTSKIFDAACRTPFWRSDTAQGGRREGPLWQRGKLRFRRVKRLVTEPSAHSFLL